MKFSGLNALFVRTGAWLRGERGRVAEDESPSAPSAEPAEPAEPAEQVAPTIKKVKPKVVPKAAAEPKAPACTHCKKVMVLKVARTGANAGGNFWGCGDYPKCRGIRAIFAPIKGK